MAGFFKLFTRSSSTSSPGRISFEDIYQRIVDNQPQNVYRDVMLLEGHESPVSLIVKINHSYFVTAGEDSSIIIWNSETGSQMHIFREHTRPVTTLCLLNEEEVGGVTNGKQDSIAIMSASRNEVIRWELSMADERFDPSTDYKKITEHNGAVNCLKVLRHGIVCSGGKDLCLWDTASGRLLSKYNWDQLEDKSEIFGVLELEGRSFGVVAVSNHTQPAVFDIKKSTMSQTVSYQLEYCRRVISYHHSPISVLSRVSSTLFVTGALDGTIVIWSMNSLTMVKRFECVEDQGYHFTQSTPSSSSAATTSSVPISHIMTLCERYLFVASGSGFKVFDIYSSDGGSNAISEIPSMPKPVMVHTKAHQANITRMEFIPEKCMLATSATDGTVRLWGSRNISSASRTKSVSSIENDSSQELLMSVETFLGVHHSRGQSSRKKLQQVRFTAMVPLLIGELCLHTNSVQDMLYLSAELGIVTVGSDCNVLLWKDYELEAERKDEEIQRHLRGEMFYDANQ